MKVKTVPEDFQVEEVSSLEVSSTPGPYAVFRLTKSSWDTFDLLAALARRLGVERRDVAVAGIKDRHGRTTQLVTVRGLRGRPRALRDRNYSAEPVGWSAEPASARALEGNRFRIVLRDLDAREAARCLANLEIVRRDGIPNYYDEQRFGSARHGAGFMGRELFLGNREAALRLWFTPSKHDDRRTRMLKRAVIERWGRWGECLPLAFGEYERVLRYLADHPRAFRRAVLFLDRRFIVFVLNAYQSWLFNELLAGLLRLEAAAGGFPLLELRYNVGRFVFPAGSLAEGVRRAIVPLALPVPGYDTDAQDPRVRELLAKLMEREGITLADLRVRQLQRVSAHGVERAAWLLPRDVTVSGPAADERYPGRLRLDLGFQLPRGSYATLVLRRLAAAGPASAP